MKKYAILLFVIMILVATTFTVSEAGNSNDDEVIVMDTLIYQGFEQGLSNWVISTTNTNWSITNLHHYEGMYSFTASILSNNDLRMISPMVPTNSYCDFRTKVAALKNAPIQTGFTLQLQWFDGNNNLLGTHDTIIDDIDTTWDIYPDQTLPLPAGHAPINTEKVRLVIKDFYIPPNVNLNFWLDDILVSASPPYGTPPEYCGPHYGLAGDIIFVDGIPQDYNIHISVRLAGTINSYDSDIVSPSTGNSYELHVPEEYTGLDLQLVISGWVLGERFGQPFQYPCHQFIPLTVSSNTTLDVKIPQNCGNR